MDNFKDYKKYIQDNINLISVLEKLGIGVKSQGTSIKALCPFHNDHEPSLEVYEKNYHCFSCGAHGDIFNIIQEINHCDFKASIKWIEENFPYIVKNKPQIRGLNIKKEVEVEEEDGQLKIFTLAQGMDSLEKKSFVTMAKERNFSAFFLNSIEAFFCGDRLNEQINKLSENKQLINLKTKESITFNMKDRLVFTFRNLDGNIIGYGGRAKGNIAPKYLFSKGLEKGKFLYRLNTIREQVIVKREKWIDLYIVEGIFDALRLESLNKYAVAVLGSHLTESQALILNDFIKQTNCSVRVHIFLDTDEAGIKGAKKTIYSLWKNTGLKARLIDVIVNKQFFLKEKEKQFLKDPDEIFKNIKDDVEVDKYLQDNTLGVFEFLVRYTIDSDSLFISNSVKDYYESLVIEERIEFLEKAIEAIPINGFEGSGKSRESLLNHYQILLVNRGKQEKNDNLYTLDLLKSYWEDPKFILANKSTGSNLDKEDFAIIQNAINIAKNSYIKEEVPLDEFTWERILACADVLNHYFLEYIKKMNHFDNIPRLAVYSPKKIGEYRIKSLYSHESLILQQYVLNELLSKTIHDHFYKTVKAVRYYRNQKSETTGKEIWDVFSTNGIQKVSFAYQVDMQALNGEGGTMFRPYFECWKEFNEYIEEGINNLDYAEQGQESYYLVRLDIEKFYDSIQESVVRDTLVECLESMDDSNEKFQIIDGNEKKHKIIQWILLELFGGKYYDPSGTDILDDRPLIGIPQGPNLSAYIANIILFNMDKRIVEEIIDIHGSEPIFQENKIKVRYARYVDDMVIVSSSAEHLRQIKSIIENELYSIGLSLSNKTEEANMYSRSEAVEWLSDERGGLGVSAVYDYDDNTLDNLIENYADMEVMNRKDGLKIFNSLNVLLRSLQENFIDDIFNESLENVLRNIFKIENVRFDDIIRFSEILLKKVLKECLNSNGILNNSVIITRYQDIWNTGREECTYNSLYNVEGIEYAALIFALKNILRTIKDNIDNSGFSSGEIEAILDFVDSDILQKTFGEEIELYKKNKNVYGMLIINLKILYHQIIKDWNKSAVNEEKKLSETTFDNDDINSNIYIKRWEYIIDDLNNNFKITKYKTNQIYEQFHISVVYLAMIDRFQDSSNYFNNIASWYKQMSPNSELSKESILVKCLNFWFKEDTDEVGSIAYEQQMFGLLLQLIKDECKAEILCKKEKFKKYLFQISFDSLRYLPVVQGVDYPGIVAMDERYFYKRNFQDSKFNYQSNWKNVKDDIATEFLDMSITDWKSLENYLELESVDSHENILRWIEKICLVYKSLNCALKNDECEDLLIPAAGHIFVKELDEYVDSLVMTYKTPKIKSYPAVCKNSSQNLLITVPVQEICSELWQAGMLIEDIIKLDEKRLWAKRNGKNEEHILFLQYAFKRLSGRSIQNRRFNKGEGSKKIEKSFQKSVQRILDLMEKYVFSSNKQIYTFECKVLDSFISKLLIKGDKKLSNGEREKFIIDWSKAFLMKGYEEFEKIRDCLDMDDFSEIENLPVRRTAQVYYFFGHCFDKWDNLNKTEFMGILLFRKGLIGLSIADTVRQQVLELFLSLNEEERVHLKNSKIEDEDLGRLDLRLELKDIQLYLTDDVDYQIEVIWSICINLLNDKMDTRLKNITPLGWTLILGWLMSYRLQNEQIKDVLKVIAEGFYEAIPQDTEQIQKVETYPFDQCSCFFENWTNEKIYKRLEAVKAIDKLNNIFVSIKKSQFFDYSKEKGRVIIRIPEKNDWIQSKEFFNYFSFNNINIAIENVNGEKIYTESEYNGRIVGFAAVENNVSKMLQFKNISKKTESDLITPINQNKPKENNNFELCTNKREKDVIPDNEYHKDGQRNNSIESKKSDRVDKYNNDFEVKNPEDKPIDALEKEKTSSNGIAKYQSQLLYLIELFKNHQSKSWTERANYIHANTDRIAFFQFDIDSSYLLPEEEVCFENREGEFISCAEYRRRVLFENIFEICCKNKVEILLLPEYSVRPETVNWIKAELEKKKNYEFSVWAGTFRIAPGYDFKELKIDLDDQKGFCYDFTAVLPVICNVASKNTMYKEQCQNYANQVKVIYSKLKSYPAVALNETINPRLDLKDQFVPVIKRSFPNVLFNDARDDITELICAELFTITSPSNADTIALAALEQHNIFARNSMEPNKAKERLQDNIREFGNSTAILQGMQTMKQEKNDQIGYGKYGRCPIILVPACTTRAVDYYLNAQANFLAAGITTVLCNAVGGTGKGGSCFIGQDSWDDNKLQVLQKSAPNSSLYHGIEPGIFQQSSNDVDNHGALGPKEQALVICDITPDAMRGKPNPESMRRQLRLVAHIPIIEIGFKSNDEKSVVKQENNKNKPTPICRCKKIKSDHLSCFKDDCLDCKQACNEVIEVIKALRNLDKLVNSNKKNIINTINDPEAKEMAAVLDELGKLCNSPGLRNRAIQYKKNHHIFPHSWPSPTFLDWHICCIDYDNEKKLKESVISVPNRKNR